MGKTDIVVNDFFKNIVDDSQMAILFLSPGLSDTTEIDNYRVAYANQKAETLFSDNSTNIQDTTLNRLPRLSEFNDLIGHAGQVILTQDSEDYTVLKKVGYENLNVRVKIEPYQEGVLITIAEVRPEFITDKKSKISLNDLDSRTHELEISNLFGVRVLDSNDSIITYIKPIFNKKNKIVDFRVDYINNRMEDIANENPESIIGKTLSEYYPKNLENGVIEILQKCYQEGENVDYTKEFLFSNKSYWLSTRAVKMHDGLLLFSKDVTQEKLYEEQLFIQNRLLSEAERVANIGSFRWSLGKEQIKYSDNVYRLFGFEPHEFDDEFGRLLTFLHPNDFERVKADFEEARQQKSKIDLVFRIYTKTNELKYMNTIGECHLKEGKWYMVGVIRDVTKQIEAESILQTKNTELKRSNSDLEAFNRVASHDLQEPLRKIQMFVSRLDEEENHRLNKRSHGYLAKIKSSSDRMRNLINNLLSYSKVEDVPEKHTRVDLNDALSNVLEDLGERVNELKADINSDSLPVVNGVQFQLEQLFANLIGNSLKYIQPGTKPVIKIKSKIVNGKEVPSEVPIPNISFVKLQFIDNGIGFDKKYQEKIFEIFQRLHGKNEFSGTGLGLSICKKIVQSHDGVIYAKGEVGKGAEFTVYLPTLI